MRAPAVKTLSRLTAIALAAAFVAGCVQEGPKPSEQTADSDATELVSLPPGAVKYYPPGEFLRNGFPVTPAQATDALPGGLRMMKRQVSQAEYAACVAAKACKPLDRDHRDDADPDLPAVGISWRDATDYAQWLSRETGHHYRLPTYAEWVYAAGAAYKEDVILEEFDSSDPAQRWLAEYALETQRKTTVDGTLRPFGGFGQNDNGLQDMAGNVWDWTDTCSVRVNLDLVAGSGAAAGSENCGVRVVAGPHRSYITDFIRDPKSGACSVGVPPSNLGFRLVRDDSGAKPRGGSGSLREKLGIG
ncbi:formylglycine-generating enzyme family protein [Parapusillimonas granuli]|uniref:SUMF1/EgtB/PvdO family nonheme iron enzyme n=1 Tax=Parapusillimonas granuli TaxID=380911 RepID=A0A853FY97_9BURK|nr:SUMF1/EgtB/PvdO family nonheme iron enzyme [Parapusillimonas granuli]MBB5215475.1 formylglycine-generating enzyme required for sulfatase activity [Parapusillimonas granuli]MEB2400312.1 SUMF1/EgtB/PvdO family nonheme iron enzyme [Alcaligenaceae bacterium]NYT49858.1 SUMF1/EgtB/PvdO family nonheme iron enzyme [Parapusillimonas granuli]